MHAMLALLTSFQPQLKGAQKSIKKADILAINFIIRDAS
jgi:hypothetical protein